MTIFIDCTLEMDEQVYEKFIENLDNQGFMLYDTGFGIIKIQYLKSDEFHKNDLKKFEFYEQENVKLRKDLDELFERFGRHLSNLEAHKE